MNVDLPTNRMLRSIWGTKAFPLPEQYQPLLVTPKYNYKFYAYCSLIYYILEELVPKQYHEYKQKSTFDKTKHIKKFPTVGNRIKLSVDKSTRLQCIHLGSKRSMLGDLEEPLGNKLYPELLDTIYEMMEDCFPKFKFNQILVNKSNIFRPHYDSRNKTTVSLIISLGDYEGDLHIEGEEFDTCLKPLIFNAKELMHSLPKLKGTKYSLLFYTI